MSADDLWFLPARARKRVDQFDSRVDTWLDRYRGNPALDKVMYGASAVGDHGLAWLIFGALRGLRSEHDLKAALRVGAGVGIESALVNIGIKSLFKRVRPEHVGDRPFKLRKPRTSSFPSGHATSAFTAAALLSEDDGWWPIYYAAAVVIASSRAYVKIHHASDVIAGVAVGVALGALGKKVFPLTPKELEKM